jgi:hypothetical protein
MSHRFLKDFIKKNGQFVLGITRVITAALLFNNLYHSGHPLKTIVLMILVAMLLFGLFTRAAAILIFFYVLLQYLLGHHAHDIHLILLLLIYAFGPSSLPALDHVLLPKLSRKNK